MFLIISIVLTIAVVRPPTHLDRPFLLIAVMQYVRPPDVTFDGVALDTANAKGAVRS